MIIKVLRAIAFLACFFLSFKISYADKIKNRDLSNEFFIVLKENPSLPSNIFALKKNKILLNKMERKVKKLGGSVLHSYLFAFLGSHVRLDAMAVAKLMQDPSVKMLVKNGWAFLSEGPPPKLRTWGIDRLDQKDLPLDDYYRISNSGIKTHSYVIDTGLRADHQEFKGRVAEGYSAMPDNSTYNFSPYVDCHGHGTHVSGTVLGTEFGVAKKSFVHPVKVFECLGSSPWSVVLKGMDWVIANHIKPAVINMSLGGDKNDAVDLAVQNATKAGIHVVVAAGNSDKDACEFSPARAPEAITVAASDELDKRASFSNWGSCIDLFAPGVNISSASKKAEFASQRMNGTSMASPHVAGAAALVLGFNKNLSPADLEQFLIDKSSLNKISGTRGSPNRLLYIAELGGYPKVHVGDDILIKLPENKATIVGQAQDYDGYIKEAFWIQKKGPNMPTSFLASSSAWKNSLILNDLIPGSYKYRFVAVDNDNRYSFDLINITVSDKNLSPIAAAGYPQKVYPIGTIHLDGGMSYDRDGSIVSYLWKFKSGPNKPTIYDAETSRARVRDFLPGTYIFSLAVTDNEGAKGWGKAKVVVNSRPIVSAGEDQVLVWPLNHTILKGKVTDEDGQTLSLEWRRGSKPPSEPNIVSPYTFETEVKDLELGEYEFRFSARDEAGGFAYDKVVVKVVESDNFSH